MNSHWRAATWRMPTETVWSDHCSSCVDGAARLHEQERGKDNKSLRISCCRQKNRKTRAVHTERSHVRASRPRGVAVDINMRCRCADDDVTIGEQRRVGDGEPGLVRHELP